MGVAGDIVRYIQQSERLVVVMLTLFIAGLAAHYTEQAGVFDFQHLPAGVRPAAILVWLVAGAHVAVRVWMALWAAGGAAVKFAAGVPLRRRQAEVDQRIIDRLLATPGLAREVLSYTLYTGKNHIWVDAHDELKWVDYLRRTGLIYVTDAGWDTVHYAIHDIAWNHMKKYPNHFLYQLAWRQPPWCETRLNEDKLDKRIEEARERERAERRTLSKLVPAGFQRSKKPQPEPGSSTQ